ncbi:LuxR C-terminal-related transcriptional regulator [Consotaella aegiceratis]|uniref:LuxR C-terminal-related transcriptional regulator n=1 Tax=Consotaella aegiceratis TaxID=3097961 RepID=UPI002F41DC14
MAKTSTGLAERLRPPRRVPGGWDRPFLQEKLLMGLEGQLVLVSGPAGYGKTELMASVLDILQGQGEQAAWLSLSPAETEADALGLGLATAFGFTGPRSEVPYRLDEALEAIAAIPTKRLALFLDGAEPGHCHSLGALLRHMPDKLRLVLATRGETGIPLSRHRMRGLLTEIDAADLVFTRSEMRRLMGQLNVPEFDRFQQLTLGWPAIARLAAARLSSSLQADERESLLSGTHRDYRAFLREEVFVGLEDDAAKLLGASACLDEIPPALAHRLAGLGEANAAERLERLFPLMTALPQRPGWFALHPLVRAVLAAEADAGDLRRHHSQAAGWFAAHGQIEKAVRHAGQAGDFDLAVETIKAAGGVDVFLRFGYTVLRRLVRDIPPDVIHASPGLRLCSALVLAKEGQIASAREVIDELKALAREEGLADIPERVLIHIDSLIDIYEDCLFGDEQIDKLEASVRSYRLKDTWERGWLHNHLCIAHTRQGNLRLARLHALKALDCYREEEAAYAQAFMLIHLALVNLLGGRLAMATNYGRRAEDLIQRTQWSDDNLLSIARIPMAETLYQQGDIEAADAILAEAMPIVSRGEGWVDVFARGFVTFAHCRLRLKGINAAMAVADQAEEVAQERSLPRLQLVTDILRIELLTEAGLLAAATELACRLPDVADETAWPARREWRHAQIVLARLRLRCTDIEGAGSDLQAFLASSTEEDDALVGLTAEILLAQVAHEADDIAGALRHLIRAMTAAQPQELIQPFAVEGEPFRDLVRAVVRRHGLTAFSPDAAMFINRIVAIGNDGLRAQRTGMLSTREADVLTLLAAGRSNKEIARELGITEATTKFHLKNLFAKLGASRRTMAVSVAKTMGLLDAD